MTTLLMFEAYIKVVEMLLTEILHPNKKLVLIVFTDRVPPNVIKPEPTIKLFVDIELVEILLAVSRFVLIVPPLLKLPILQIFCDVRTLPNSSFPTNKLEK